MNYAVVATKIDPQTKEQAMQTAKELGIPLSLVIKTFLKQFINAKSITFSASEEPSDYLKAVIKKAEENLKKGKHSPILRNPEEAVSYLDKLGI